MDNRLVAGMAAALLVLALALVLVLTNRPAANPRRDASASFSAFSPYAVRDGRQVATGQTVVVVP
jgi:hypothetical protein